VVAQEGADHSEGGGNRLCPYLFTRNIVILEESNLVLFSSFLFAPFPQQLLNLNPSRLEPLLPSEPVGVARIND